VRVISDHVLMSDDKPSLGRREMAVIR
jgi:hypothetical protein